jgi:hypothetical protein
VAAVRSWARTRLGDETFEARRAAGQRRDVTAAASWALRAIDQLLT